MRRILFTIIRNFSIRKIQAQYLFRNIIFAALYDVRICPCLYQSRPFISYSGYINMLFIKIHFAISKIRQKNNNIFTQNRTHHLNFGVFLIYIVQTLCLSSDIVSVMNRNEKSGTICVMKIISRNFLHIIMLLQREIWNRITYSYVLLYNTCSSH